jgi:arabinofuranosyltransferase
MVCSYLLAEHNLVHAFGFNLDDSWIHATIARNLAEGNGYAFNPGHPISGSTAPLFTALLALWYLVFGEVIWGAKLLGIVGLLTAAAFLYLAAEKWGGKAAAWTAALLCLISPAMLTSSLGGMELGLYFVSPCAAMFALTRKKYTWMIAALALGVWLRPEAVLLLALGFIAVPREDLQNALTVAAFIVVPYFAFNMYLGNYPFPATVHTKSAMAGAHFSQKFLDEALPLFAHWHFWPLFLLAPLGMIWLWKRAWWIAIFPPLFVLIYWASSHTANSFARYLHPMLPCLYFSMALGVAWIQTRQERWVRFALLAIPVLLIVQGYYAFDGRNTHALAVQNITDMQVSIGRFLNGITDPTDVVATNDIGAIGFFSQRFILDLMGLVSPLHHIETNLSQLHPEIVAIFDRWWPQRLESPTFQNDYARLWSVSLSNNVVCGDSVMTVYARKDRFDYYFSKLEEGHGQTAGRLQ